MINFTVDVLALYFSARFSKIATTTPRLLISGITGALYAVFGILLIEISQYMIPISLIFLCLMVSITAKGAGIYRKLKYSAAFLFFQILIGGLVYYGYCMLDKLKLAERFGDLGGKNRKFIILALLVLLSIGILKLFILFFGNSRSEKNIKLKISYGSRCTLTDAFVDSGNLATDPLDKTPVMLVTRDMGIKIFGSDALLFSDIEKCSFSLKKRIRLIPLSFGGKTKLLYGIKPDSVFACIKDGEIQISVVIAIDLDEKSYGGYRALVPMSAVEDISYGNN